MQGTPQDYMSVGVIHFMTCPQCMQGEGPVMETVAAICNDVFFDAITVTHIADATVRRKVAAYLQQARVKVSYGVEPLLLAGNLDINSADDAERGKAVVAVKRAMDEAVELGSDTVSVLSGKVSEDIEHAKARLVRSLSELCAFARSKGLSLILDVFDRNPIGKNCLIGPTAEAVEVIEQVKTQYDNVGLMVNLAHLPLLDETAEHALKMAAPHLTAINIGNCAMDNPNHPAYGDNHPRFGAEGTRIDTPELTEFLHALRQVGYIGPDKRNVVSFEVRPMKGERSAAVLAGTKRTLLEAWRRV